MTASTAGRSASPRPDGDDRNNAPDGQGAVSSSAGAGETANYPVKLRPVADAALDGECARFPLTDLGNAERFVRRHGRDLRFCAELGWFRWDGRRWELLSEERDRMPAPVMQAVFATIRAIKNEAIFVRNSGEREDVPRGYDAAQAAEFEKQQADKLDWVVSVKGNKATMFSDKIAEWARSSESGGKLNSVAQLAKSFDVLNAEVEDFDSDRMAINCLNGTLRLEKLRRKRPQEDIDAGKSIWHMVWGLKLHEHCRDDLITKITRVNYKPNAKAPVYADFMKRVQPDAAMRRFIAQWGGLSMTGYTGEQKLAFFYGSGRNGKGTWVETAAWIAGDYADTLGIESLLDNGKRRGEQATPDIARLPGVRFLRVSEPSKGGVLNEGLVKMVTGEDPVSARHLNKGFFIFDPDFKITISGNNKPAIRDTSDGIWRRMQLVPWDQQIPKSEVDTSFKAKLLKEADGIFAWLMRGLIDWRKNGLIEPDAVKMATSKYRDDSDTLGKFLRQCCTLREHRKDDMWRVKKRDLYDLFEAWCAQTGDYHFSDRQFSKEMEAKGFEDQHSNGAWWLGINRAVEIEDVKEGVWTAADERDSSNASPVDPMAGSDDGRYYGIDEDPDMDVPL